MEMRVAQKRFNKEVQATKRLLEKCTGRTTTNITKTRESFGRR